MERCETCKEFIYSFEKEHKCKPLWLCRICSCDDDKYTKEEKAEWFEYKVYAYNEESAAEQCAEDKESDWDHSFVNDGGVGIDVMNPETEEIKKFYVSAEPTISYSASDRKDD